MSDGFEMGADAAHPSFPRKRESRGGAEGATAEVFPPRPAWIPAFAGMTERGAGMTERVWRLGVWLPASGVRDFVV